MSNLYVVPDYQLSLVSKFAVLENPSLLMVATNCSVYFPTINCN